MTELLILTAVLGLAAASLFLKKTVPAMISFALMMFLLGIFYLAQEAKILGLFQIFIYTGGILVLMLFGLTIIGVEFPEVPSRPWTAAAAFGVFVAMSALFLRGRESLHAVAGAPVEDPGLFATGFADTVILFALIAASLLYGTVRMIDLLKARSRRREQGTDDGRSDHV
ncbi:NADH-quinone oxidoreductase subunit J family protein [Nitratifractor sp.]